MAEILHQLIGSLSHYLQGFIHPRWCRISSMIGSLSHYLQGFIHPRWCRISAINSILQPSSFSRFLTVAPGDQGRLRPSHWYIRPLRSWIPWDSFDQTTWALVLWNDLKPCFIGFDLIIMIKLNRYLTPLCWFQCCIGMHQSVWKNTCHVR